MLGRVASSGNRASTIRRPAWLRWITPSTCCTNAAPPLQAGMAGLIRGRVVCRPDHPSTPTARDDDARQSDESAGRPQRQSVRVQSLVGPVQVENVVSAAERPQRGELLDADAEPGKMGVEKPGVRVGAAGGETGPGQDPERTALRSPRLSERRGGHRNRLAPARREVVERSRARKIVRRARVRGGGGPLPAPARGPSGAWLR